MKQFKIVNAYRAMEALASIQNLTKEEQWAIYQLRKSLRSHVEFQEEQEEAIKSKYKEFADENGKLPDDKGQLFIKEINELSNIDVELKEFDKPQIKFVEGINFTTVEYLEDFIEFIPPDE